MVQNRESVASCGCLDLSDCSLEVADVVALLAILFFSAPGVEQDRIRDPSFIVYPDKLSREGI